MQPSFVTAHPDHDLVRIKMGGFFGPADVDAFNQARFAAHAQLRCGPNQHLTLADLRDLQIQAQDVLALFRDASSTRRPARSGWRW